MMNLLAAVAFGLVAAGFANALHASIWDQIFVWGWTVIGVLALAWAADERR